MLSRFHEDGVIEGLIYQGDALPEGDPKRLWDALADADDDDPRFDELPTSHRVRLYREDIIEDVFGSGPVVAAND